MTHLINQLMNDKGVCRTAPATPGLLNIALLHRQVKNVYKGVFSHIKNYVTKSYDILNLKGNKKFIIEGLKIKVILMSRRILPIGEVATGRFCTKYTQSFSCLTFTL